MTCIFESNARVFNFWNYLSLSLFLSYSGKKIQRTTKYQFTGFWIWSKEQRLYSFCFSLVVYQEDMELGMISEDKVFFFWLPYKKSFKYLIQLTSWRSFELIAKCIHLLFACAMLGIVSWEFIRRLITQIQSVVGLFFDLISKDPHSEFRRQMSRHSIFVNTSWLESFMSEFGVNLSGSLRRFKSSWKLPKAFWHDWQVRGMNKIRKIFVKTTGDLDVGIFCIATEKLYSSSIKYQWRFPQV